MYFISKGSTQRYLLREDALLHRGRLLRGGRAGRRRRWGHPQKVLRLLRRRRRCVSGSPPSCRAQARFCRGLRSRLRGRRGRLLSLRFRGVRFALPPVLNDVLDGDRAAPTLLASLPADRRRTQRQ